MNATVKDNKYAWDITKEFLGNETETHLFLKIDSEYSKTGYTIVKLPFEENIYLLYAASWHDSVLHPGIDLKYAGFYNRQNQMSYNVREPITGFFGFDGKHIYESETKKIVKAAIQKAAAEYIISIADKYIGLPLNDFDAEIINDAETAFSKKETVLNFAAKFPVEEYWISETEMVEYIDNPDNIHKPESLLKRKMDGQFKGSEEKFARLWFAHCTSQKLLDRLYAENAGGVGDE
jgi:hypothetical protein